MPKLKNIFVDTETCGLHGMPVLLQHAVEDGPIKLTHLWLVPIKESLSVIELIVSGKVIAHNLRFDWFHLSKWYNTFRLAPDHNKRPLDYSMEQIIEWEYQSQYGLCLKPYGAIDTYILSQKGEHQSMIMDAKPVLVRRVPRALAEEVRQELEERTDLPAILFANRNATERWQIAERVDEEDGEIDPEWVDLKMVFAPSNGLKDLAQFVLGYEPPARFDEIAVPKEYRPEEIGYVPYVKLLLESPLGHADAEKHEWRYDGKATWPELIQIHIDHWATHEGAIEYATEDINMLRMLFKHYENPEQDDDSELAAQVASCRLRGFKVNLDGIAASREQSVAIVAGARINVNSHIQVKNFVAEALDPMEQLIISKGCGKQIIAEIVNEYTLDEQEDCYCEGGLRDGAQCPRCEGKGVVGPGPMPVVMRVKHVEKIRQHIKRIQIFDKLLLAKRFYASFKVIGAKSGRMSGADDFNPQGVDRSGDVRELFELAEGENVLSGGDFASQELSVMATAFNDKDLVADLCEGKSLHGIFATCLDDTKTYDEVMDAKELGEKWAKELYNTSKQFVYASSYGGTPEGIAHRLGLQVEIALAAYNRLSTRYPAMGNARKSVTERFSAMKQPKGRGTEIIYCEAENYIESMFGYRRYFTIEYQIQKILLDLVHDMPARWKDINKKVIRRDQKLQTIAGAISSALYGGAYSVQNKVIRAAMNHLIQSASRTITMGLHYAVWKLQPCGIHPFKICLMSIHDELQVVSEPDMVNTITNAVEAYISGIEERIPLISMEWGTHLNSWNDKGKLGQNGKIMGWSLEKAAAA